MQNKPGMENAPDFHNAVFYYRYERYIKKRLSRFFLVQQPLLFVIVL